MRTLRANANVKLEAAPNAKSHQNYQKILDQFLVKKKSSKKSSLPKNSSKNMQQTQKKLLSDKIAAGKLDVLFMGKYKSSQDSVNTGLSSKGNSKKTSHETFGASQNSRRSFYSQVRRDHQSTGDNTNNRKKTSARSLIPILKNKSRSSSVGSTESAAERLKKLAEDIKERNRRRRKGCDVKVEVENSETVKRKSMATLLQEIKERRRKRELEYNRIPFEYIKDEYRNPENTEVISYSSEEPQRSKGYDIFNVQDGIDVQFLVKPNFIPEELSDNSYNSIAEEMFMNDERLHGTLRYGGSQTLHSEYKALSAQKIKDIKRESASAQGMFVKRSTGMKIGTRSDLNSSAFSPLGQKPVQYLGRRVNASNTLDNIPSLKEDLHQEGRRSLKKRFTVPTR